MEDSLSSFFSIKNESRKPIQVVSWRDTLNGQKILGASVHKDILAPGSVTVFLYADKTSLAVSAVEEADAVQEP